ncbi:hypothetical protein PMIN04_012638 [Paraphaeosphaeria minitans]
MKTKQKNVCHTCRAHKIGCDGKYPSCSQCLLTRRQCGGYELSAIFVAYSPAAAATTTAGKARSLAANQSQSDLSIELINHGTAEACTTQLQRSSISCPISVATSEEFAAVIVRYFIPGDKRNLLPFDSSTSQVCGAWVGILPQLAFQARPGNLLSSAIKAFGTAILDRNHSENVTDFRSYEAYTSLIQQLRRSLVVPEPTFTIHNAIAVLCLAMVEFLIRTPHESFHAHLKGLGALLQSQYPGCFSSGVLHALFIGCRPVLLFQALQERKRTFLAQLEWIEIPFCEHRPSPMQNLLSDVATLPSILQDTDLLPDLPHDVAMSRSRIVSLELVGIHNRLLHWVTELDDARKCLCSHLSPVQESRPTRIFSSLLDASLHIHVCSFRIICLTEIKKLAVFMNLDESAAEMFEKGDLQAFELAVEICHSIEYVLQDEMELYGPISALFPLVTAYDTLQKNRERHGPQLKYYRDLLVRIRQKGVVGGPALLHDIG